MRAGIGHWLVVVITLGIYGCASAGLEHNKTGLHYLQERNPSTAEAEFRQAIAADPDNAMFHNNLGNALFGQQRYDEALAAYRRAIELKSDYAAYHLNLGKTYYALGDSTAAHRSFRKAIDVLPYWGPPYFPFVRTSLDLGILPESIAYLESLLKNRATPDSLKSANLFFLPRSALAFAHLLQGNLGDTRKYVSDALDVLWQVKTEKPGYPIVIFIPGPNVPLFIPGTPIRFNIDAIWASFYNLQGLAQFGLADYDGATESFRASAAINPPNYLPHLYLGRVALEKNDLKEALFHFRSSLEKETTDLGLLYDSVTLKLSGDEAAAQAPYERAVSWTKRQSLAAKSHFEYFEALGLVHQAWGRLDEAIAAYTRVVDAVPQLGHGHRRLGEVYWLQGNTVAALSHLREAQRLMPNDSRTTALLKEIGE